MKLIDDFLNNITMYRLVLYELIGLILISVVFSFTGNIPYSPASIIISTLFLVFVAWITNSLFSKVFNAPTNTESAYITALILALIISPMKSNADFIFLFWAAFWGMAGKYIFAIGRKHIFNPAAIAVVLTSFVIGQSASWWIGTSIMAPFIAVGGLLIVRKIRREDFIFSFFMSAFLTIFVFTVLKGSSVYVMANNLLLHSSLLFFAFIMLTEPLTTPPTKTLQIIYGIVVGILFAPQINIAGIYSTPELALVVGNIFSYLVSPKQKFFLTLSQKINIAPGLYDFLFHTQTKLSFAPGQYMEWTLSHDKSDSRGDRRYFTIASSPTEDTLRLGVRVSQNGSSFKKALENIDDKKIIVGASLSGDFTLPKDVNQKLVFIAGGIGITPFRSMMKYLVDTHQKRDIVLFYSNKNAQEIMYEDVFTQAKNELEIKTVYTLTDKENIPALWQGSVGRIDAALIQKEVPDFKDRVFYLSGPHNLVTAFEQVLREMGINQNHIKIDFFPGFV
jgi:glycine betaine catabolism B